MRKTYGILAVVFLSFIFLIMGARTIWAQATFTSSTGKLHVPGLNLSTVGAFNTDWIFTSGPAGPVGATGASLQTCDNCRE